MNNSDINHRQERIMDLAALTIFRAVVKKTA
jgi:hypothetical protein